MDRRRERYERIRTLLACPACGSRLNDSGSTLACPSCEKTYPVVDWKPHFITAPAPSDSLDRIKFLLKKYLRSLYYTVGIDVIAPTFPFPYRKEILRHLDPKKQIVVDAGCGNRRIDDDVICLDMFDYDEVDVICDLENLPFMPQSVDAFVTRSVLEHVASPWKVVSNFEFCTKHGGLGLHLVPFLMPTHSSPNDYHRFTKEGLRQLFSKFEVLNIRNATGPFSLLLLCATDFLSILLSPSNTRIRSILYLIFCLCLFPIKFLDFVFVKTEKFSPLSPSLVILIKKR